jgi:COP9 signalosome complex subunit 6
MANKEKIVIERESGTGQTNLALHPLVILNISDHWTRTRVQNNTPDARVIGALLGIQTGRDVEIYNSFELVYEGADKKMTIDLAYLNAKQEQMKKVFPLYDFLGWYSTGSEVTAADIEVHKQLMEVNESPLYLLFDTIACGKATTKELPISIFESELHIINDQPTNLFVKVSYKIETGEAERIAVDHIAKISSGSSDNSLLTTQLTGVLKAINMLSSRIKILKQFLELVKAGKIAPDQSILRRIASICDQLPAIDNASFKQEFINEYNDALMVTYLSSMTKGAAATNELIDKFNVSHERVARRRGLF